MNPYLLGTVPSGNIPVPSSAHMTEKAQSMPRCQNGKAFCSLVTMIAEDRLKVDLQPLFFAFSMNAAIEILTSEDLQSEERRFLTKDNNIRRILVKYSTMLNNL
jgi:hypothetical protein